MKKCRKCGTLVNDAQSSCPICGSDSWLPAEMKDDKMKAYPDLPKETTALNGWGIAGTIVGILSYLFCLVPVLNLVTGGVGVAISSYGMYRWSDYHLSGFAVAGLILGSIGCVLGLIFTLLWL